MADVLTKGDHPRGIKVRLRDGRVGRVQRMGTGGGERAEECAKGMMGDDGGGTVGMGGRTEQMATENSGFTGGKYGDYRVDGYEKPETQSNGLSLADYVVPKQRGKGKGQARKNQNVDRGAGIGALGEVSEATPPATSTCPVCGQFEGDEAAVAHHVSQHFE